MKHQYQPTDLSLKTWLLLGGRGSGKTFAGSVWIDVLAREFSGITLALVGPALHDVREVMVEGASGIKALAEPGDRPRWEAGRRRLVWKNQSAAYAFSAEDPGGGVEQRLTLTGVSRSAGSEEAKAVAAAVRACLHDAVLEADGVRTATLRATFADVFSTGDGRRTYAVVRLRAVTEEVASG